MQEDLEFPNRNRVWRLNFLVASAFITSLIVAAANLLQLLRDSFTVRIRDMEILRLLRRTLELVQSDLSAHAPEFLNRPVLLDDPASWLSFVSMGISTYIVIYAIVALLILVCVEILDWLVRRVGISADRYKQLNDQSIPAAVVVGLLLPAIAPFVHARHLPCPCKRHRLPCLGDRDQSSMP